MKSRVSSLLTLSLFAALVTGCGGSDDPAGPGESNLSQEEALIVFGEILSAVFLVGLDVGAAAADGPPVAFATETIDETVPCEGGGTIALTGSVTGDFDENFDGDFEWLFTETPNNCGVTTDSGASYRVNGSPNIQMNGSYSIANGAPVGNFNMSFTGGLSWTATNGGASGSCSIDLQYAMNWNTQQGSVTGSMCGYNYNEVY